MRVAVTQTPADLGSGNGPGAAGGLRPWVQRAKAAGCHLVLFPALATAAGDDFLSSVAGLAGQAGLLLGFAAERPGAGRVGFLFGPDGRLLGRQAQTQVSPEERDRDIIPGSTLEPIALPPPAPAGLKAGFLVSLDAWCPEVARILTLKGAALLLAPLAMPVPYSPWRQVAATWQQVQQNQVFGLEACLVGPVAAPTAAPPQATAAATQATAAAATQPASAYAGRSGIFAPCEMTPGETGILAQAGLDPAAIDPSKWADGLSAAGSDEPGLVVADLDFGALQRTVDAYSLWEQQNLDFYRSFFPGVYGKASGAAGRADGGETP